MRPHDVQMREYTVMKKLKHWNIVPLLDIEEEVITQFLSRVSFWRRMDE